MKKWILIICLVIIVVVWQTVEIYQTALDPKQSLEEHAKQVAKDKAQLKQVESVSTYYGKETYSVVKGSDNKKDQLFVWVSSKSDQVMIRKVSDGISKNQALTIFQKDRNPKKIIKMTLGMEENIPLWEITYIDQQDRYSFYYLDFETGQFLKRYSL